ncbi:pyridoxal-phosphate dependent enzyme [Plebeiibacterium marinum]|uniref:Pyridoxal-phosphate dependent enzyme n=1 Tax=Plebeiibacterium marinum TaxID=2992111 RepID=A0AAE3MGY3_9BACT|nr:pyridoxal-phosphate dependent enzyme [Plebeiobacterium marinum]MCW3807643.1 pyridoxal-phosphate dependent enzyme [Plebeiobacterium marinum]
MNILDGVKSAEIRITKEVSKLSDMVKDKDLSIVDRIESLEDIISLEIGDTSLNRAKNLEREMNLRQLYIKYEGENPTGTQKDRIAFAQVHDAFRRGFDIISVATCGNYGVAVAFAAYLAGVHCKIFIPETYHTERVKEMERFDAEIIRLPGTYEDAVSESSRLALVNDWYDANPGGANTSLQISAYAEIAKEIYDQLRDAPKYVAAPVSNGTLLAGVYRGFVSLYKRGKTSRIPIFIAGSSAYKNPIIMSFKSGLDACVDIDPKLIKETVVNEPLINWHSFDGNEALFALRQSDGEAHHISDKKMKDMSVFLHKKEGYRILPASTSGLIALLQKHEKENLINDRYVAILTGKY